MPQVDKDQVIANVRKLYAEDEKAKVFLDWMAAKERDWQFTTIEQVISVIETSRREALELLRKLEIAGCGSFKAGRRGHKTRIEWAYSQVELGRAAAGEIEEVDEISQNEMKTDEDADDVDLTVTEAKRLLAQTLGVEPDQIKITITV